MNRRSALLSFAILLLTQFVILESQSLAQRNRIKIDQIVDEVVEKEMKRQKIVGVSVGLIIKGRVVHAKGYGFADIDENVACTDETIINWASNSKPVMAVLAMQLVQQGKLDLDATVDEYLPSLPEHLHGIKVRQLLCHQSGIPHYSNGKIIRGPEYGNADKTDPVGALQSFINSPLIFEPGTKTDYSSYAYILLSAVVQAAGEEPIADQIANRISGPLKLDSFQTDADFDGQENWSRAYRIVKGKPKAILDVSHAWKHGAGAYKSNVKDFAAFANALIRGKLFNSKTNAVFVAPQVTADGEVTEIGLGIYVSGSGKSLKLSHNGSQDETKTRMVIFPRARHGVVVMCNCRHADPGKFSTAIYGALKKNKVKY